MNIREDLRNMPMNIHRPSEPLEGCCRSVSYRQFERFLNCIGCPSEPADVISCPETTTQAVPTAVLGAGSEFASVSAAANRVDTSKLSGAATPGAAIVPPGWMCPLSGMTCPFARTEE